MHFKQVVNEIQNHIKHMKSEQNFKLIKIIGMNMFKHKKSAKSSCDARILESRNKIYSILNLGVEKPCSSATKGCRKSTFYLYSHML